MTRWYRLRRYSDRTSLGVGDCARSWRGSPCPASLQHAKDRPRLGPVLLELVEVPLGRREDVDDHGAEVDEDPVRRGLTLAPDRPDLLGSQGFQDPTGDCRQLAFRAARADDEVVGNRGQPGQVEQDDVGCLLVLGDIDDPAGHLERRTLTSDRSDYRSPGWQAVGPGQHGGSTS